MWFNWWLSSCSPSFLVAQQQTKHFEKGANAIGADHTECIFNTRFTKLPPCPLCVTHPSGKGNTCHLQKCHPPRQLGSQWLAVCGQDLDCCLLSPTTPSFPFLFWTVFMVCRPGEVDAVTLSFNHKRGNVSTINYGRKGESSAAKKLGDRRFVVKVQVPIAGTSLCAKPCFIFGRSYCSLKTHIFGSTWSFSCLFQMPTERWWCTTLIAPYISWFHERIQVNANLRLSSLAFALSFQTIQVLLVRKAANAPMACLCSSHPQGRTTVALWVISHELNNTSAKCSFVRTGYSDLRKKVQAEGCLGGIKAFFWAQRTQQGDGGRVKTFWLLKSGEREVTRMSAEKT